MGVLIRKGNRVHVTEYTELSLSERIARLEGGELKYPCANLSLFCYDMDFVKKAAQTQIPWHTAAKKASKWAPSGHYEEILAYKFEKFIFDLLPAAEKVSCVLYPREACFAPLKNLIGKDSPESVKRALQNFDGKIFQNIAGFTPTFPFELSPQFYYPTEELLARWKSEQPPQTGYIE